MNWYQLNNNWLLLSFYSCFTSELFFLYHWISIFLFITVKLLWNNLYHKKCYKNKDRQTWLVLLNFILLAKSFQVVTPLLHNYFRLVVYNILSYLIFYIYFIFLWLAASCQPCSTCLHIPLCTVMLILIFNSTAYCHAHSFIFYILFLYLTFYSFYFMYTSLVLYFSIFALSMERTRLSFHCWLYNLCIVVYVTNKTWNLKTWNLKLKRTGLNTNIKGVILCFFKDHYFVYLV